MNVFGVLLVQQRVAPFYHDPGLELVGLIENFGIVAQLVHLVVEHLLNLILSLPIMFQETFGRRRSDANTFSYMTSPVSIRTTFGIQ